jgi:hypothetical protein
MKMFTTLALGACMTVALTGAGFAQSSSSMSSSDKAMMTKCQGMSQSAMKADKDCTAFMQKHPDMMKSGTTGTNASQSGTGMGSKGTGSGNSGAK